MKAQPINNAIEVISHESLPCGIKVVVTPCIDQDGFVSLPKAITFNGATYGRSGWNSDRNVAYFRTDRAVAYS